MSGPLQRLVAAEEAEQRLDRWLKRHFPEAPHALVRKLLRTGQIRVDGRRAAAEQRLTAGQAVRLPPQLASEAPPRASRPLDATDVAMLKERILHQDAWVIALDKPAGLAVQGGSGQTRSVDALLPGLVAPDAEPPRLVHRLDRDTSGVLLVGCTAAATRALTAVFRDRSARKLYWALVAGTPPKPAGRIDLPLSKDGGAGQERMAIDPAGEEAVTLYAVAGRVGRRASFLVLSPLTGRTHQLRVHLAHLGCPILGDAKYGGRAAFLAAPPLPRQLMLHARELAVPHPDDGTTLRVTAPPPLHLQQALAALGLKATAAEKATGELMKRGA